LDEGDGERVPEPASEDPEGPEEPFRFRRGFPEDREFIALELKVVL